MRKKICSLMLILAVLLFTFASCNFIEVLQKDAPVKVGVLLLGDEHNDYTKAHLEGLKKASEQYNVQKNKKISLVLRKNVDASSSCLTAIKELVDENCALVVSTFSGHEKYMREAALLYSEIQFVALSGKTAAVTGIENFKNAYPKIHEARYVSGVAAGLKLQELIDENTPFSEKQTEQKEAETYYHIGYVASVPSPETTSGYTAFYLGVQSVVKNVKMTVGYTGSFTEKEKELEVANRLISDGAILLGQDTYMNETAKAVEEAHSKGTAVFTVGSHESVSNKAPETYITSAKCRWDTYYFRLFEDFMDDGKVSSDVSEGYDGKAVDITEPGAAAAAGTKEYVEKVKRELADHTLHVFDTNFFTVKGQKLNSYEMDFSVIDEKSGDVEYEGFKKEVIQNENGHSYFAESTVRSAPYFDLKIDGIQEK